MCVHYLKTFCIRLTACHKNSKSYLKLHIVLTEKAIAVRVALGTLLKNILQLKLASNRYIIFT